jgi:hypothetical protein
VVRVSRLKTLRLRSSPTWRSKLLYSPTSFLMQLRVFKLDVWLTQGGALRKRGAQKMKQNDSRIDGKAKLLRRLNPRQEASSPPRGKFPLPLPLPEPNSLQHRHRRSPPRLPLAQPCLLRARLRRPRPWRVLPYQNRARSPHRSLTPLAPAVRARSLLVRHLNLPRWLRTQVRCRDRLTLLYVQAPC